MVFSSLPAYLDPSNWQQQPNHHHHQAGNSGLNTQLPPGPPPQLLPPPPPQPHGGAGGNAGGSIRPGSMVERARLANIPMPEAALKCPRCESTNTKFCYFNNYSLSQPRHFCKTCRRYWTRGGALRNVPVGGGCRRNKRSKGSSSKSPITSGGGDQQASGSSASSSRSSSSLADDILSRATAQIPGLRYMSPGSLSSLAELGNSGEMGLNYGGIPGSMVGEAGNLSFQLGGNSPLLSMGSIEHQLRLQQVTHQIPFMSCLDKHTNLYPMDASTSGIEPPGLAGHHHHQVRPNLFMNSGASQMSSVKVEGINQSQLNLSRQLMGNSGANDQFWSVGGSGGGNAWTDLSGFSSSSTSSAL